MSDLKKSLLSLLPLALSSADISVVEVFRNKVHIVHQNDTLVKHVNDSRSSVYAYERCIYDGGSKKVGRCEDANFFSNNLDTDSSLDRGNMEVIDANIEVNIDVSEHTKQFKNKLEQFNPEAKVCKYLHNCMIPAQPTFYFYHLCLVSRFRLDLNFSKVFVFYLDILIYRLGCSFVYCKFKQ